MYSDDNLELTRDEQAALAALPRELDPGDLLEAKVIRALREQGHLGAIVPRAKRGPSLALKIAAAVTLFAGGVATGKYLLASDARESASATAPVTEARDAAVSAPRNESRPAPQKETVVAVREMWL
jgi:hypothetical protein